MTRERIGWLIVLAAAGAILAWVARNTYWSEIKVPMPLKGEAATNPFYAIQQFARTLGAQAQWNRGEGLPPADGIVFLSAWHWDFMPDRRRRLV